MKLIVGLGNPEEKYSDTRHNLGFKVVDKLVSSIKYRRGLFSHEFENQVLWEAEKKFKSQIARISQDILVVKPQTFMNNSGMAVKLLTTYYKIPDTNLVIVHDELDLPLGHIKVRLGGAAAGHHGVESVIKYLGTDKFIRVRCGIGPSANAEKFVLSTFLHLEKHHVRRMIKEAVEMIEDMVYCKL